MLAFAKMSNFGDTLKLTFISYFRKFEMGLALFCNEVDEKKLVAFLLLPKCSTFASGAN